MRLHRPIDLKPVFQNSAPSPNPTSCMTSRTKRYQVIVLRGNNRLLRPKCSICCQSVNQSSVRLNLQCVASAHTRRKAVLESSTTFKACPTIYRHVLQQSTWNIIRPIWNVDTAFLPSLSLYQIDQKSLNLARRCSAVAIRKERLGISGNSPLASFQNLPTSLTSHVTTQLSIQQLVHRFFSTK